MELLPEVGPSSPVTPQPSSANTVACNYRPTANSFACQGQTLTQTPHSTRRLLLEIIVHVKKKPLFCHTFFFNTDNSSMIGNRLEETSKGYLKRYQKIPKVFSLTQAGINFMWVNPCRMHVQSILKHLQHSSSAAFPNIILKTSVIFTTRKLILMYCLNRSGVQFIPFPFLIPFMCLNTDIELLSLIFQINKLRFPSLSHISDFLALSGSFSTLSCLSWHTVPKPVTRLLLRPWERKDGVEELCQIGPPKRIWPVHSEVWVLVNEAGTITVRFWQALSICWTPFFYSNGRRSSTFWKAEPSKVC